HLATAIRLSIRIGCALVVMCSGAARASRARRLRRLYPAARSRARFVAVDLGSPALPRLVATDFVEGVRLGWSTANSTKRNPALAVAKMAGWRNILFLDDDMRVRSSQDVLTAAAHLDAVEVVGLRNVGFPDNSVVCYAARATGAVEQASFIGSGAMLVRVGPQ